MFQFKKGEIATYIILLFLTGLFSILLLAKGYPAWFLFASAVVIIPCAGMLIAILCRNKVLSGAEAYLSEENYKKFDAYAAKHENRYFFIRVYAILSLLERGDADGFLKAYEAYGEKNKIYKDWLYKLEAYKVFYQLLSKGEISLKTVNRLESAISAEEVERERCICKMLDYYNKGDLERAIKQLGWYEEKGGRRFLNFMYGYVCNLIEEAASEGELQVGEKVKSAAYNDFLRQGASRFDALANQRKRKTERNPE